MVDYKPEGTNIRAPNGIEPGVYVLPAFSNGKSPLGVTFTIVATPGEGESVVTEYAFKTDDGKIIKGEFDKYEKGEARATVSHTFKYSQGKTKYYGHTFYPDVTIKTKDGAIKTMNHDHQKAVSVWVKDPAYTKDEE